MSLRRVLASVVLFSFAFWFSTVAGAIGFQPVSPDELKMTGEPLAPGAPAIILFRQVDRDDNGRTSHEDNYFRIKILKEEGRKYADVEIPYFKGSGNISVLKGRTIRPDGSVVNFEGKAFDRAIVKRKGMKYMAKTFTLPDVQVGGIIEYFYTIDLAEYSLYNSNWVLSDELFTKDAKFSLKPYESTFENNFSLRWSWNYLPAGTTPPKEDVDKRVRMEVHNIPAFVEEDFMPPENELKARVDFIYSQDAVEKDPAQFWKKVGKKRNDALESFVGKRKAMEQAVSGIVGANDSAMEKLQKIYAHIQQMRNTSYEVRKTEQEEKRAKEKEIKNVEDLWKLGYGNGRDLTWLFLGMARAAGLEAYGVWLSDRGTYFFDKRLMDSSRLDANVVLVKVDGKDLYFDPGAAYTSFGLLPWVETGVEGLRMDKDGGTWIKTTLPESADSQIKRKADLKLMSDTGSLEGKLTVTYTGLEAQRRRLEERNQDDTERQAFLENEVKEYVPAAAEVELANKPEWKSSERSLVAEFNLKIPGWTAAAGRRALLPVGIFSATEKHVFDHADRVHPMYFEFPQQRVDEISIDLPSGWQVSTLPKPQITDAHVVSYAMKVEDDKGKLRLSRTLNLDLLLLDAKYYGALRAFFHGVRAGDEEQIVLQPGTTTASN